MEEKLINLFGFNLIGPNNSNRWEVYEQEENIGYIQYKKLHNKNIKKNLPAIYGYVLHIDNGKIKVNNIRKSTDKTNPTYVIEIKNNDEYSDTVELTFNDTSSITLWSKNYGFMNFSIDNNNFYLNFRSQTENFNLEETIILVNGRLDNENYSYTLIYCPKSKKITDDDPMVEFSVRQMPYTNEYDVTVAKCENNKYSILSEDIIKDLSIANLIEKQELGISAFKHFRYLINKIIPCQKEIISTLLEDKIFNNEAYSLFIPDIKLKQENTLKLKK